MKEKPLILLVNDDGILSPGLIALSKAVAKLGEVMVVAPWRQQTSMSRAYVAYEELGVIKSMPENIYGEGIKAFSVVASPAHCVVYAVLELAGRKPDLCVSGINYGENLGKTISYSGTLGAAFQAADFGIKTIAVSRPAALHEIDGDYADLDWTIAQKASYIWAKKILNKGMAEGTQILNINVPEKLSGVYQHRITAQSRHDMFIYEQPCVRDLSKHYKIPSKKRQKFDDVEKNSDIWAAGLTVVEEAHGFMHGEKVAFGVLVQHIVEGYSNTELNLLLDFYSTVGLPTRLRDMNVPMDEATIRAIAEKSIIDFGPVSKLITVEDLCAYILSTDSYAAHYFEGKQ